MMNFVDIIPGKNQHACIIIVSIAERPCEGLARLLV